MPLNLSGQKIKLRPLEARDLDGILPMYQDFDLQLTTDGDAPPLTDTQVRAFWEEIIAEPGPHLRYFAIEPLVGNEGAGQFAGASSLQHIDLRNRHAELGIFMAAREMRGQGYGTEATRLLLNYGFEVLRLDKIYLGVYDFNEGGLRTYENIGFRYEGRLKNMLHYEGRYWDEWPMRILRVEWKRYSQPPSNGLRLYHPADLEAALNLIQEQRNLPDREAARNLLRQWWRQIDRDVYGYQIEGRLVGVATVTTDGDIPNVLDVVAYENYDSDFIAALQNL